MDPVVTLLSGLVGLAVGWLLLVAVLWLHRPSRDLVGPALRLVPDLLRLVRRILADRAVPRRVRAVLSLLLLWLVSPIDLLPEFLPVVGALDDLIVAMLVLRWVSGHLGIGYLRERWPGTPESFALLLRVLRVDDIRGRGIVG